MALSTFSKFYFNYEITIQNYKFDFDEGAGELTAELTLGVYTPTDLAIELKTQLDATGTKTYSVVFNRNTRVFTISVDTGTFDILILSGTNSGIAVYTIFGFNGAVDLTGAAIYLTDPSGSVYNNQFILQDYVPPENWIEKVDAAVNKSASGKVEVVSFGEISFTEFNFMFITDLVMDGLVIKNNPNGVSDANAFLTYCIKRGPIEFMPDESNVNLFYKITLEKTRSSGTGTGYQLKEETGKKLPGIYQSEKIQWRVST